MLEVSKKGSFAVNQKEWLKPVNLKKKSLSDFAERDF